MSLAKDEVAPDDSPPKPRVIPNFPWFMMSENFSDGISLICGDRRILVRPATGETGPKGPFPFISLTEEGSTKRRNSGNTFRRSKRGFCLHSEDVFNELWEKLEEMLTR